MPVEPAQARDARGGALRGGDEAPEEDTGFRCPDHGPHAGDVDEVHAVEIEDDGLRAPQTQRDLRFDGGRIGEVDLASDARQDDSLSEWDDFHEPGVVGSLRRQPVLLPTGRDIPFTTAGSGRRLQPGVSGRER